MPDRHPNLLKGRTMDRTTMMVSDSMKEAMLLLRETAREAQDGSDFLSGKKMGILAVLSILQHEARSFGIAPGDVSLPDEDIVDLILREYG